MSRNAYAWIVLAAALAGGLPRAAGAQAGVAVPGTASARPPGPEEALPGSAGTDPAAPSPGAAATDGGSLPPGSADRPGPPPGAVVPEAPPPPASAGPPGPPPGAAVPGEAPAPGGEAAGDAPDLPEDPFAREAPAPKAVADPLEPLNRALFFVNDKAYFFVLKPVAKGYRAVVPREGRTAIGHFFANLAMPIRFANHLLQGKVAGAGNELLRFAANTTLGVAGFFDVAGEKFGLKGHDEDFGQTLGRYGLGHGFFVTLPLLGPSSLRDGAGLAADSWFLDPWNYVPEFWAVVGARTIREENDLADRLGVYEDVVENSVDPYAAVRDAYVQFREKRVRE